jgi:predicted nucleic acid-binding protein
LARAQRNGRLTHRQLRSARRGLGQILDQVDSIELTASVAKAAGALAEGLALRAYDAVHLASASILDGPDFVFVSGDRRLVGAAMAQNLNVASLARGN